MISHSSDASRAFDLPPSEVESWIEDAKKGMENALRANPLEFITPHCPQQNDMVERVIRTLKEQCVHQPTVLGLQLFDPSELETSSPPNLDFHLQYVAELIACLRQISLTGTAASASFRSQRSGYP